MVCYVNHPRFDHLASARALTGPRALVATGNVVESGLSQ